jgi:hypothetical protein
MRISFCGRGTAMLLLVVLASCTSVDKMYTDYQKGDESQYARLLDIAGRHDYPYATRRSAVRALGEIGKPEALPVLLNILHEFDRRTSLKEESLIALGRIGDPAAVTPIGHLLDRSLTEPNADLRMTAMPVLARLGGEEAAEILVNALMYYDVLMTRSEQSGYRGVFTGEEQAMSALRDSVRQPGMRPGAGIGEFSGQTPSDIGFFGSEVEFMPEVLADTTPKERDMVHQSLIGVGVPAVGVIQRFLEKNDTTTTLRLELGNIVGQIQAAAEEG